VLLTSLSCASVPMNNLSGSKDLDTPTRDSLYQFHLDLVGRHQELQAGTPVDIVRHPHIGFVRAQLYMNLLSFALPSVSEPEQRTPSTIPQEARNDIATAWHCVTSDLQSGSNTQSWWLTTTVSTRSKSRSQADCNRRGKREAVMAAA
jgi:hypothetical protein